MASSYANNFHRGIWQGFVETIWGVQQKEVKSVWPDYMEKKTKRQKMFEDVGMVGPDLWLQTNEGNDLPLDQFGQGYITYYEMEKFAKRLIIPEEFEIFGKYEQIYDGARMLSFTEKLTEDYYAVQFLNDAFTTANGRQGGDGIALCSTSHPLKGGSTWSNSIGALSPSNTAIGVGLIQIERTVGENGRIDGMLRGTKLVGPSAYRFRMKEILKSAGKDDTSNNAINALKGELSSDYVSVPLMTSSQNWFIKTGAMAGLTYWWGVTPRFRKISHETNETTVFLGSAFWTGGWSDPRTMFGYQLE